MMLATHPNVRDYVCTADAAHASGTQELERLVRAAARGHEAAWSALVARFIHRLGRIVRGYRVPANDVDDIVQSTFIRLYEHLHSLRDPRALSPWLETTARRETLKRIRAGRRECPLEDETTQRLHMIATVDEYPDDDLSAQLRGAIERLPRRQRELMRLLDSPEEPSYEEISRRLSMPIGSIGPTRARALERLRGDEQLLAASAAL